MEEIHQISGFKERISVQKFIQIYLKNKPYLIFFDSVNNHYSAFEEFLNNFKISYTKIEKAGDLIPSPEGENYKFVGAGQTQTFPGECILHGESSYYNLKPNKKHLEDLLIQKQIRSFKEDMLGNNKIFYIDF